MHVTRMNYSRTAHIIVFRGVDDSKGNVVGKVADFQPKFITVVVEVED